MRVALSADASVKALQERVLTDLGLTTEYTIGSKKTSDKTFTNMLTMARIECIDSMEAYFSRDLQPAGCISERNEGAAISLLLQRSTSESGQQQRIHNFVCRNLDSYRCMPEESTTNFAAGGPAAIKARLASHAQQLSEDFFSEYTQHQKGTSGSDEGPCSSDEGALQR